MHKVFWCGAVTAVTAAAAIYWLAEHSCPNKRSESLACSCCQRDDSDCSEEMCVPDGPGTVSDSPPQPARVAAYSCLEPIDLYEAQETPSKLQEKYLLTGESEPRILPPSSQEIQRVVVTPADIEGDSDSAQIMPPCCDECKKRPDFMPYADNETPKVLNEGWMGLTLDMPVIKQEEPPAKDGQKIIIGNEKIGPNVILRQVPLLPGQTLTYPDVPSKKLPRIDEVLPSELKKLTVPARPKIDTLEFRPSDAKKGEFDRIPF
jgi:hypothetical protein